MSEQVLEQYTRQREFRNTASIALGMVQTMLSPASPFVSAFMSIGRGWLVRQLFGQRPRPFKGFFGGKSNLDELNETDISNVAFQRFLGRDSNQEWLASTILEAGGEFAGGEIAARLGIKDNLQRGLAGLTASRLVELAAEPSVMAALDYADNRLMNDIVSNRQLATEFHAFLSEKVRDQAGGKTFASGEEFKKFAADRGVPRTSKTEKWHQMWRKEEQAKGNPPRPMLEIIDRVAAYIDEKGGISAEDLMQADDTPFRAGENGRIELIDIGHRAVNKLTNTDKPYLLRDFIDIAMKRVDDAPLPKIKVETNNDTPNQAIINQIDNESSQSIINQINNQPNPSIIKQINEIGRVPARSQQATTEWREALNARFDGKTLPPLLVPFGHGYGVKLASGREVGIIISESNDPAKVMTAQHTGRVIEIILPPGAARNMTDDTFQAALGAIQKLPQMNTNLGNGVSHRIEADTQSARTIGAETEALKSLNVKQTNVINPSLSMS